ncbi:porin [Acidiphilium sp.]|uniref:porin n=1 Tax=Acidiphilium sp. TaxID=527 RepID=UPI00258F9D9B|nr:porin [Acidiphilium sp.]
MRKYLLASAASLGLMVAASGAAHAQAAKAPAPGQIVVHLNGLLNDQINMIGATGDNVQGGNKLNPIGMAGFLRLYPGFDATTENGIQYGAAVELRTAFSSAGAGIQENSSSGSLTGLAIRRAYAYVGTPQTGFVRFGQTDGIWWLLSTGEYYNFGDGNLWNSDGGVGNAVPSQDHPAGLFTSSGALYTTNKIVYISPDIDGFKAGFDFEPNSNGFKQGEVCSLSAATGCATLSSAAGGAGNARRKNTITGGLEYSGEFSGTGVTLAVDYLHAAPVGNSLGALEVPQPGVPASNGKTLFGQTYTGYKSMGIAEFSGQVKYAGFTLGANVKTGQVNDGYTFLLPGQRDLLFYEVTGIYDFGPYTVGAYYFNQQSAGAYTLGSSYGRTATNYGIAVGANYALSKNLGLYATYLYGHRHQAGYNFISNDSTVATGYDNVQSQAFSLGAALKW